MLLRARAYRSHMGAVIAGSHRSSRRSTAALDAVHNVDDFQRLARDKLERPLYEWARPAPATRSRCGRTARPLAVIPRCGRARCGRSTRLDGLRPSRPSSAPAVFASPAGVHSRSSTARASAPPPSRLRRAPATLRGLSQHATVCIEDVAAAAPAAHRWYQSYLLKDRDATFDLVRRAVALAYRGVFLTVDSVRFGFREVDARNNFCALPPPLTLANYVATPPAGEAAWEARERAWDQNSEALFDTAASWDAVAAPVRSSTRRYRWSSRAS